MPSHTVSERRKRAGVRRILSSPRAKRPSQVIPRAPTLLKGRRPLGLGAITPKKRPLLRKQRSLPNAGRPIPRFASKRPRRGAAIALGQTRRRR